MGSHLKPSLEKGGGEKKRPKALSHHPFSSFPYTGGKEQGKKKKKGGRGRVVLPIILSTEEGRKGVEENGTGLRFSYLLCLTPFSRKGKGKGERG